MRTLFELAGRDSRVCLVVGDLGYAVVEQFAEAYPSQFVNAGVAEQNMTGVAAGMALTGKIVFTYSIANFATLRCLEQIRNDVCYHGLNVKVVAVGGGLAYGALGMSHHASEDIAILRSLPEMVVVAPGDPVEAELATQAVAEHDGPCYLRLGRTGEPVVHKNKPDFRLGRGIWLLEGRDITLISTGGMLDTAVSVAHALAKRGFAVGLLSMHTVKPIDVEAVMRAAAESQFLVTIEEHSIIGGLGSAVAEVIAEHGGRARLKRVGLRPSFNSETGDQLFLKRRNGLDEEGIIRSIEPLLTGIYGLVS